MSALYEAIKAAGTMNDIQFVAYAMMTENPIATHAELMILVNEGKVIMSEYVDGTGRTIGGVYSLPGTAYLT